MDKLILTGIALAVFLHLAGAFENGESQQGSNDNPYLVESAVPRDTAAAQQATPSAAQGAAEVVVYGRDSCGYTQQMLSKLDAAQVAHRYKVVDKPQVLREVAQRLRNDGHDPSHYKLPVVAIEGETHIRPKPAKVISAAEEPSA